MLGMYGETLVALINCGRQNHIFVLTQSGPRDSNVIWRTVLGFGHNFSGKGGMLNYNPELCMHRHWVEEG